MSALVLEDHDFAAMVGEIWSSILMPEPVEEHDVVPMGDVLAGYVDISGGWHGRVVVETTDAGAIAIAASMFDLMAEDLAHEDLVVHPAKTRVLRATGDRLHGAAYATGPWSRSSMALWGSCTRPCTSGCGGRSTGSSTSRRVVR